MEKPGKTVNDDRAPGEPDISKTQSKASSDLNSLKANGDSASNVSAQPPHKNESTVSDALGTKDLSHNTHTTNGPLDSSTSTGTTRPSLVVIFKKYKPFVRGRYITRSDGTKFDQASRLVQHLCDLRRGGKISQFRRKPPADWDDKDEIRRLNKWYKQIWSRSRYHRLRDEIRLKWSEQELSFLRDLFSKDPELSLRKAFKLFNEHFDGREVVINGKTQVRGERSILSLQNVVSKQNLNPTNPRKLAAARSKTASSKSPRAGSPSSIATSAVSQAAADPSDEFGKGIKLEA